MPAGDRTGPLGRGPMTGRGMGYCGNYDAPGWANWGPGRRYVGRRASGLRGGWGGGYGPGRGGAGRGWRHWYYATGLPRWARSQGYPVQGAPANWAYDAPFESPSREQEIEMLKDEAAWLKEQLDAINGRMDELSQE
jgi:hypothetical protein